ncbi:hypothetical protein GMRT_15642 [Giardia muris]|uniref:Uncharacterized protein n=1 Tax=Giardia muris TaxID=5742 RepID=A0A4Z1T6K5_GIAMU|nr:hypothetical protein GMRT_15642 [Giardia muris]|eukprot:TNJ28767.1 hypothetical protein GMRT_15642 [Giardia muris]
MNEPEPSSRATRPAGRDLTVGDLATSFGEHLGRLVGTDEGSREGSMSRTVRFSNPARSIRRVELLDQNFTYADIQTLCRSLPKLVELSLSSVRNVKDVRIFASLPRTLRSVRLYGVDPDSHYPLYHILTSSRFSLNSLFLEAHDYSDLRTQCTANNLSPSSLSLCSCSSSRSRRSSPGIPLPPSMGEPPADIDAYLANL